MDPNMEMIRREGVEARSYLDEFIKFVFVRTGFRLQDVMIPRHLEKLLNDLSFNRVPLKVWNALMSIALRIVNLSQTITHSLPEFGSFFIDVLVWLCRQLITMGILIITVFLFNWKSSSLIGLAVYILQEVFQWLVGPLWEKLINFIQSRLISAPYYHHFARNAS